VNKSNVIRKCFGGRIRRSTEDFLVLQVPVQTEGELVELMQQGIANRTVARTGMNTASSRSHCLVMLMVEKHWRNGAVCHGKLCLVDLAGGHNLSGLLRLDMPCCTFTEALHALLLAADVPDI